MSKKIQNQVKFQRYVHSKEDHKSANDGYWPIILQNSKKYILVVFKEHSDSQW